MKEAADQDLLTHLLRSIASHQIGGKDISDLLRESQNIASGGAPLNKLEAIPAEGPKGLEKSSGHLQLPSTEPALCNGVQSCANGQNLIGGQNKLNNFDLNDVYIDSDDGLEDLERSHVPVKPRTNSLGCLSWMPQESHQSSPPQTSGTSDSASALSPSSSNGDTQVTL